MSRSITRAARIGAAAGIVCVSPFVAAGVASADTSAATAQAASLQLGATSVLDTGTESASNPGGSATDTETATPALSLLGTQSLITAGALQQTAVATGTGGSSGCAGVLGNGASITVGASGLCDLTTTSGETGGVTLGIGGTVINATAIVATCSDSSTGSPTGSTQLVDASAVGGLVTIPANPAANTTILGLIDLNTQTVSNGQITVTALSVPTLGLKIGTVTCGPDATTGVSSAFPVESLPIAAGTAAVVGGAFWYRSRRRAERATLAG